MAYRRIIPKLLFYSHIPELYYYQILPYYLQITFVVSASADTDSSQRYIPTAWLTLLLVSQYDQTCNLVSWYHRIRTLRPSCYSNPDSSHKTTQNNSNVVHNDYKLEPQVHMTSVRTLDLLYSQILPTTYYSRIICP